MRCREQLFVASAVLAAACGAAPASSQAAESGGCKLIKIAEWPVRIDRDRLLVEGAINGQPVGILLDTGASRTLITRAAADRLKLTRQEATGQRIFGVGGESDAEVAYVDELRIGESVRRNWSALVAGELEVDDHVAMLLGEDLFQSFEVEFDLKNGVVRLHQSRDCGDVPLAYWTREAAGEAAMESGPKIILPVQIDGQPIRAMLDSGAGTSMLATGDAERLGVAPGSAGVVPGGCRVGLGRTPVDAWIGKFRSFVIGNELIHDPKLYFSDLWRYTTYTATGSRLPRNFAGLPQMLLGADFLRAHRVLISYSQRKVYFSYAGGVVFPTRERKSCAERAQGRP